MQFLFYSPEILAGVKFVYGLGRNRHSSNQAGIDANIPAQSLAIPGQKCKNVELFEHVPIV
jgi:hypothetical protein